MEQKTGRILLAEDDEIYAGEILQCLDAYNVSVVHDGQKALDVLAHDCTIELCILDERMPRLNGTEVLAEIRKLRPELKIILMTGLSPDYIRKQILSIDSSAHTVILQKDIDMPVLLSTINGMLSAR